MEPWTTLVAMYVKYQWRIRTSAIWNERKETSGPFRSFETSSLRSYERQRIRAVVTNRVGRETVNIICLYYQKQITWKRSIKEKQEQE